jgi:hypothetical protein
MHNLDVKVPGEHTIEGERFDAEIQMFHTHLVNARLSSIGIPVRARDDGHNEEFQAVLDEFQAVYDSDARECQLSRRRLRTPAAERFPLSSRSNGSTKRDGEEGGGGGGLGFSTPSDDPELARRLQREGRFNPYGPAFMPTIFFYRYDGSITEPPCTPITWWVMNEPMIISRAQLSQIKYLLFTHVDGSCRKTSVHNADQEVTRPIQPLGDNRDIQKCVPGDFRPDVEKGRPIGQGRC